MTSAIRVHAVHAVREDQLVTPFGAEIVGHWTGFTR
jgi:hypothetical protein